jgi:tRNA(fMet)-specific endonuclease VapC
MTGALKSALSAARVAEVLAALTPLETFHFDDAAADKYAEIRVALEKSGFPIGPNDYMIAAIAIVNDLTLVSHNTADFFHGCPISNWQIGSDAAICFDSFICVR